MKWILLAVLAFVAYAVVVQPEAPAEPAATGRIAVVSLNCEARTSHTDIGLVVQNVGSTDIKHPTVFIRLEGGHVDKALIRPSTLPAGAMGDASSVGPDPNRRRGESVGCEVIAAQDASGRSIL